MNWAEITGIVIAVTTVIGVIIASQRYNNHSRNRIYQRLDECKIVLTSTMEKDYARKDICVLTHQQNAKELKEIKEKTDLIPGIIAHLEVLVGTNPTK